MESQAQELAGNIITQAGQPNILISPCAKAPKKRKSRRLDMLLKKQRHEEKKPRPDEPMVKRGGAIRNAVGSPGDKHLLLTRPGPIYSLRPYLRLATHRAICNIFETLLISVADMDRIATVCEAFQKPGAEGVMYSVKHHDPECGDYTVDVTFNALREKGYLVKKLSGQGKTWWQHVTTNPGPFLVFIEFKEGINGNHCIGISGRGICNDEDTDATHIPLTEENFKNSTTPPRRKAKIVRLYQICEQPKDTLPCVE